MQDLIRALKSGEVAVIPTDTLYGLVGSALNKETVEKIYTLKKRNPKKPLIILISSIGDLKLFGTGLTSNLQPLISTYWPGPTSIILPCSSEKFKYLHRGTKTLAFRLPDKESLIKLLKQTGPLVAPSANTEGQKGARTVGEAKKYFLKKVKYYLDEGKLDNKPSTVIKIEDEKVSVLRS